MTLFFAVEQLHIFQVMDHQAGVAVQLLHLAIEIGILYLPEPFLEKVHIALQLLNVFLQLLIIDPAEFFHFLLHMPHPITSKSIASLRQKRKPDA